MEKLEEKCETDPTDKEIQLANDEAGEPLPIKADRQICKNNKRRAYCPMQCKETISKICVIHMQSFHRMA